MPFERLGIVVALDAEARTLRKQTMPHGTLITLHAQGCMVVSGMGACRAEEAAQVLIDAGVQGLVSWGTAGGLQASRQAGDLLLPDEVFWLGRAWAVDAGWRDQLRQGLPEAVGQGGLCSVNQPCTSVADKAALLDEYPSAQAVDMESGAIAVKAQQAGIPFVVVRSVVDPATQSLPISATRTVDPYGRPQMGRLLRTLLRHPADIRELLQLGTQMSRALRSLRAAGPVLLPEVRV
ncbi:MAG: nucleosidase [Acidithiobacillus sp.]